MDWTTEELGFNSWQVQESFLFFKPSRLAPDTTQPSPQRVLGVLSPGVKWLGCEADNFPLSSAEIKK